MITVADVPLTLAKLGGIERRFPLPLADQVWRPRP